MTIHIVPYAVTARSGWCAGDCDVSFASLTCDLHQSVSTLSVWPQEINRPACRYIGAGRRLSHELVQGMAASCPGGTVSAGETASAFRTDLGATDEDHKASHQDVVPPQLGQPHHPDAYAGWNWQCLKSVTAVMGGHCYRRQARWCISGRLAFNLHVYISMSWPRTLTFKVFCSRPHYILIAPRFPYPGEMEGRDELIFSAARTSDICVLAAITP